MNTRIELKSALGGFIVGGAAMLAMGAANSSGQSGRYQIAVTGNPAIAMLVDTQTGKVWSANATTVQLRNDTEFFQVK